MRRRGPRGAHQTPASPRAAGVSAFGGPFRAVVLVALSALGVACAEAGEAPVIETADGSVELDATARVHEVAIERLESNEIFQPSAVTASRGDVVRFTSHTLDSHAIAFQKARLTSDQQRFLAETGQESSPPILAEGDAWLLSLAEAPAGVYPFLCLIHETGGRVEVAQP